MLFVLCLFELPNRVERRIKAFDPDTEVDDPSALPPVENHEWRRLRVKYETMMLARPSTLSRCMYAGERIRGYMCAEGDLLTPDKINTVKDVASRAEAYFSKLCRTIRIPGQIRLSAVPEMGLEVPYDLAGSDIDVHVTLYVTSQHNQPQVFAGPTSADENLTYRPTAGIIIMDPKIIADNPVFHTALIRGTLQILGLHPFLKPRWVKENTLSTLYGENEKPFKTVTWKNTRKKFSWINTPSAHRYMADEYGVEKFENYPSGILMTSDFKWMDELRFKNDVMTPTGTAVTKASLSLLQGTGWYKVDLDMAQPNIWNDKAVLGKYNQSFWWGPPSLGFPKSHLCEPDLSKTCSYNPLFPASCPGIRPGCKRNPDQPFCSDAAYYNPLDMAKVGSDPKTEYQRMPQRKEECALPGHYMGLNLRRERFACVMLSPHAINPVRAPTCMSIDCSKGEMRIVRAIARKRCRYEGQRISFETLEGYVECPDPDAYCAAFNISLKIKKGMSPLEPAAEVPWYTRWFMVLLCGVVLVTWSIAYLARGGLTTKKVDSRPLLE